MATTGCEKEDIKNANNNEDGAVTVSVAFGAESDAKTVLDGKTPKWVAGDQIKLINSSNESEVITLTSQMISDGKATFRTSLVKAEGDALYAVYPASVESSLTDNPNRKLNVIIPEIQDGTFASANICGAYAKVSSDLKLSLQFRNIIALIKFVQPAPGFCRTETITIVHDAISATGDCTSLSGSANVQFDSNGGLSAWGGTSPRYKGHIISVPDCKNKDVIYVAVKAQKYIQAVDFIYMNSNATEAGEGGKMFPQSKAANALNLSRGKIYTINLPDLKTVANSNKLYQEYTKDGKTVKFACYNIGSAREDTFWSPINYKGTFYAWGQTTTQHTFENASTFADAATANWGKNWRMPTKEELKVLFSGTKASETFFVGWYEWGNPAGSTKKLTWRGSYTYKEIDPNDITTLNQVEVQNMKFPVGGYWQSATEYYPNQMWYWTKDKDGNGWPLYLKVQAGAGSGDHSITWGGEARGHQGMLVRPVYIGE